MGTLKDSYDILADLLDKFVKIVEKKKNKEMLDLAFDIQQKLFVLKNEMSTILVENDELHKELAKRNNQSSEMCKMSNGAYSNKVEFEKGIKILYCSNCYENEKQTVPLTKAQMHRMGYYCPKCKANYSNITVCEE